MNLKALQEAEKALSCIEPPTIGLSFEGMLAALLDVSRRFREKSHHSVASTPKHSHDSIEAALCKACILLHLHHHHSHSTLKKLTATGIEPGSIYSSARLRPAGV